MNRRDFIKHIAMLTGPMLIPEQLNELVRNLEINAIPQVEKGLVYIDDIFIGGFATKSTRIYAKFFNYNGMELNLPFNAFGGIIRWVAGPNMRLKITTPDKFCWEIISPDGLIIPGENSIRGGFLYIDQEGRQHRADFEDGFEIKKDKVIGSLEMILKKEKNYGKEKTTRHNTTKH